MLTSQLNVTEVPINVGGKPEHDSILLVLEVYKRYEGSSHPRSHIDIIVVVGVR